MTKNFFDFITFPNSEQQIQIINNFYDTHKLFLSLDSYLKLNNLSKQIKTDIFNADSLFTVVNKDLREKIRRFNNDIIYLTLSIYRFVNYYDLMEHCDENSKIFNELLFRKTARCVSCELFMYEEKIKNIVRIILNFNKKATKKFSGFMRQINLIAKTNIFVKDFSKAYRKYRNNPAVIFVKNIRNNEIHNDSQIDEYTDTQELAVGVTSFCDVHYSISNQVLYDNIKQTLIQLELVKNELQQILDNHKI